MAWKPILLEEKSRIESILQYTVNEIISDTGGLHDPSLSTGLAGKALFLRHYYNYKPSESPYDEIIIDWTLEVVASNNMSPSFFSGFTGVAWVLEQLFPNESSFEGDANQDVDKLLLSMLQVESWREDYDLIFGLVGFGVYTLARLQQLSAVKCLEKVIGHLDAMALPTPCGSTWLTTPEMKYFGGISSGPHFNLGVSHGVSGILGLLSQVCLAGMIPHISFPLLKKGSLWLLAQVEENSFGRFAKFIDQNGQSSLQRNSLSWCYGELGIAVILCNIAQALLDKDIASFALELGLETAIRPLDLEKYMEPGLCHGSAGIGHLYNRLYQFTGDIRLKEATKFWLQHTLTLVETSINNGGSISSSHYDANGIRTWNKDFGLLSGASGIALALLASISTSQPTWDQFLLLSGPYSGFPVITGE